MVYGSVLSMFCAIVATFVAAFFLYDPIYSLYVEDPREVGELILFAGTALIGAECTAEITRPTKNPRNDFETMTNQSSRGVRAANPRSTN
jgi:K+-sensing histidine kinase KdpD